MVASQELCELFMAFPLLLQAPSCHPWILPCRQGQGLVQRTIADNRQHSILGRNLGHSLVLQYHPSMRHRKSSRIHRSNRRPLDVAVLLRLQPWRQCLVPLAQDCAFLPCFAFQSMLALAQVATGSILAARSIQDPEAGEAWGHHSLYFQKK